MSPNETSKLGYWKKLTENEHLIRTYERIPSSFDELAPGNLIKITYDGLNILMAGSLRNAVTKGDVGARHYTQSLGESFNIYSDEEWIGSVLERHVFQHGDVVMAVGLDTFAHKSNYYLIDVVIADGKGQVRAARINSRDCHYRSLVVWKWIPSLV